MPLTSHVLLYDNIGIDYYNDEKTQHPSLTTASNSSNSSTKPSSTFLTGTIVWLRNLYNLYNFICISGRCSENSNKELKTFRSFAFYCAQGKTWIELGWTIGGGRGADQVWAIHQPDFSAKNLFRFVSSSAQTNKPKTSPPTLNQVALLQTVDCFLLPKYNSLFPSI